MVDYRNLLLELIGTLTLDEHMGDVSNSIVTTLRRMEIDVEWEEFDDLRLELHKLGVTTLYGSELCSEEPPDAT